VNDPRRLLDEGANGFEARLLRSGRNDAPSAHSRRRIAAALGIGGVFGASTIATGASANAPGWFTLNTAAIAKVAGGVVAGALAVYGGAQVLAPAKPAPVIAVQAPRPLPAKNAPETIVLPAPAEPAPAEPKTATPVEPQERPADTLPLELAALDKARRALASGDAALALARLDEYNKTFPKPRLKAEATVLRIEALAKSGSMPAATRLGREFLKRNPNGPYARRVTSLIGEESKGP
jgi:hypothetical protein